MNASELDFPLQWRHYCLPYKMLSNRLRRVHAEFGMRRVLSSRTLVGETKTFAEVLDAEVEKIVLFYMSRKGDISRELLEIRGLEGLQGSERLVEYRRVAEDVLHLLHFLEYNIAALHHILRKHDRQFDLNMSSLYFETRLSLGPHSGSSSAQLVQLYHQEELKAIISTLRRGLEDAYDCERVSLGITDAYNTNFFMGPSLGSGNRRQGSFSVIPRGSFGKQYRSSNELRRLHSAKNLMRPNGRSFHRASDYLKSGAGKGETPALTRSISELEPILKKIDSIADKFTSKRRVSVKEYLTARSEMALEMSVRSRGFIDDFSDDSASESSDEERDDGMYHPHHKEEFTGDEQEGVKGAGRTKLISFEVVLVLISTFLIMTNFYIIAPSSAELSRRLGESPSMSGLIIGMTPLAAILSAFVYSYWSNFSYISPLKLCSFFLILGNLLYGAALQCDSVSMVFAGRLLTGLGVSRVVCRRYIVDHVPHSQRTDASHQFVTAGALGLAFGPLLASLIELIDVVFTIEVYGQTLVRFEKVSAPGWVMLVLWSGFTVLLLLGFTDPYKAADGALKIPLQQTRGQKYEAIEEQVVGIEDIPAEDFEDRATAAVPALSLTRRNYQKSTSSACTETSSLLPARTDRQSAAKPPDRLSISQESSMEDLMASTSSNLPNYYSPYANSSWLAFLTRPGEWCSYHPGPLIDLSGRLSGGTQSQLMVNSDDEVGNEDFNCLDHMSVEVYLILLVYFFIKTGQEMVVSSSPLLTSQLFQWSSQRSGYFMAFSGLLVLPFNILTAKLLAYTEDRRALVALTLLSLLAIGATCSLPSITYSSTQYMSGSILLFAALNAIEGTVMALLARLLSPALANSTFNSGLLATEAGTLGRVVGDMLIAAVGARDSGATFVNNLFVPLFVGMFSTLLCIYFLYDRLET